MWAAAIEVEPPAGFGMDAREKAAAVVRYVGVLAVWAALAVVRPRLAVRIWKERRAESPLRRAWPSGLTPDSQRKVRSLRR